MMDPPAIYQVHLPRLDSKTAIQEIDFPEKFPGTFKAESVRISACRLVGQNRPSGWLRALRALTSRLIFLAGVKWSCLRVNKPVFPPSTSTRSQHAVSLFRPLLQSQESREGI